MALLLMPAVNLASLIHRYASRGVESQVSGYLDEPIGKLACSVQEPLLAYLLKRDPESARSRLQAAIAARGEGYTACNRSALTEVGRLQNHPLLEEIALPALDDPDPQVVGSAAAYLAQYGSAAAEEPLWTRYIAWSRRWRGREADLSHIPGQSLDLVYEAGACSNLMRALAAGQGWLTDENKLRHLIALSAGPQQRHQAEQYLQIWQKRPWEIRFISFEQGQLQIAQYHAVSIQAAKDKLRQFPRGSRFRWPGRGDQDQKTFRELSMFAAGLGIEIGAAPSTPPRR